MQILINKPNQVLVKGWTEGVPIDSRAIEQIDQMSQMSFIHPHIAIMPDVHWGSGATIGSVIPTYQAIIPAAVGVDIGCGMMACQTSLKASALPDNLHPLRCAIEKAVPHGRTDNGGKNDRGAWDKCPYLFGESQRNLFNDLYFLLQSHPGIGKDWTCDRAMRHLGTLGTGNHFIELCLDENDQVWIMLHSGSRGIGNAIGRYFIELAKNDMKQWLINLPDQDLAYLPEGTQHFEDYIKALNWAQAFAAFNREFMMQAVQNTLNNFFPFECVSKIVNCHHNYVAKENHFGKNVYITRKGAVRARETDLGIIPGSMGAKSFIVRGKGNPHSFHSCSHGAGRIMSRTEARKTITLDQHIADTKNVECRQDIEVIDETPKAYKDIEAVMAAQSDLIEIVHTLKQVLCVKG